MIFRSVTLLGLAALGLAIATPAQAMTGHDAAVACEARAPKCNVEYAGDGSILVTTDDGYIVSCPTPSGLCSITTRPDQKKPKPKHPKLLNPAMIPKVLAH